MKGPRHLVFVCVGNRNRSPFSEFFFSKLLSERDRRLVSAIHVTSAGFVSQMIKDKMAEGHIGLPEPFFGRPMARTTLKALRLQGIIVPETWRTKALSSEMVGEADMIITSLPDQKKDLMMLYPTAADRIFTIREVSQWEGYLLQEDPDYKGIPRDDNFWDYVEENAPYVSSILSEVEKMLNKAYPNILNHLGFEAAE
ncbi:MAG: hypothetical protein JXL84_07355 [Deltaproteobacteria bacterium]|nr:hypothetical protein [Deltaproteobacteria bacterium]